MILSYWNTVLLSSWIISCFQVLMVHANVCYNILEKRHPKYCSSGCCGPENEQYCCLSTVAIIGIVIGIVVAIVIVVVIIIKCCNKAQGARGRVRYGANATQNQPIPQITIMQASTHQLDESVAQTCPEAEALSAQQSFPSIIPTVTIYTDEPDENQNEPGEEEREDKQVAESNL